MSINNNDISQCIDDINKYKSKIYTSIYPQIKMIHINFDENFNSLNKYIDGYLSLNNTQPIYTYLSEYKFILNEMSVLIDLNIVNIICIYNEIQIERIKYPVSTWINPIRSEYISIVFTDMVMDGVVFEKIRVDPTLFNMIIYFV